MTTTGNESSATVGKFLKSSDEQSSSLHLTIVKTLHICDTATIFTFATKLDAISDEFGNMYQDIRVNADEDEILDWLWSATHSMLTEGSDDIELEDGEMPSREESTIESITAFAEKQGWIFKYFTFGM